MTPLHLYVCVAFILETGVFGLDVSLSSDGPAVRGSNVTFIATVFGYSGETLRFDYFDTVQPQHHASITKEANTSTWTVEYPRDLYKEGEYSANIRLMKSFFGIWLQEATASTTFKLTESLNGKLILNQNNTDRPNSFVAVNKTVHHYVKLPDNELQFLKQNSSSIVTHWFLDCLFLDTTTDFALNYTYDDTMGRHYIEALVVANNEPLPTTTTTTTTTTPPPTTTTVPSTTAPTTTQKPATSPAPETNMTTENNVADTNNTVHKVQKRAISNRTFKNSDKEFECNNTVPVGKSYTIGRYQQTVNVREPLSAVTIDGLNWLQHGDLLHLDVKYSGSPPFDYCIMYKRGQYNVTGNESCGENSKTRTISNVFPLVHYFSEGDQHTVVVVIENDMGKIVSRETVNIYKASVHAQLSVIVVPVFFCLVAVILVVFGIAYYQHRSRHTVEVANFDFGQANPEYMTFTERLRDSFRNACNFGHRDDTDPLTPDTRYDSMT